MQINWDNKRTAYASLAKTIGVSELPRRKRKHKNVNVLKYGIWRKLIVLFISFIDRLCSLMMQSSWLQIQRPGFDSRHYQIFWEAVCLERGPLNLVSTIEELFGRKSRDFCLESREYGRRHPSRWPRGSFYPQKKMALASPTSGGHSVGIVRSWTQATEFSFSYFIFSFQF
jgi:hypothetical protein